MDDQQTVQTQASQPDGGERPSRFAAGAGGERGGDRGERGDRGGRFRGGRGGRGGPGRRKQPIYADNEIVDYKDIARLRLAIDERGKILPRRKTHCSAHIQRELTVAIKRARHMALLPFVPVDRRR
jgi:small subunit ribosomal protein S18